MKCILEYDVCHLTQRHKTILDHITIEDNSVIMKISALEQAGYFFTVYTTDTDPGFSVLCAASDEHRLLRVVDHEDGEPIDEAMIAFLDHVSDFLPVKGEEDFGGSEVEVADKTEVKDALGVE